MAATLHKLTAGDGYLYLIRQVAASDSTERGRNTLSEYYSAKGESPGRWVGTGLASLSDTGARDVSDTALQEIWTVPEGSEVHEQQMAALFGEGLHPNAVDITNYTLGRGAQPAVAIEAAHLGRRFAVRAGETEFQRALAVAYREHNARLGQKWNTPIDDDVRAKIRTTLARQRFADEYGRDPVDDRELSGFIARNTRARTTAVAGYDVTFSPVKSVSAFWAVAPLDVAREIEECHDAAVADALASMEAHGAFTRSGAAGVAQVDTTGLIGTAFTHRDSRAGDPDLHTHVAISNKVATIDANGVQRWLALDGQPLHRVMVSISELYNTRLEAHLGQRLGLQFTEMTPPGRGKRPIREIIGVNAELNTRWSSRRQAIEARTAELSKQFQADHGREPTNVEAIALAQQATLQSREAKHEPRSLAEQRQTWRSEAIEVLGGQRELSRMIGQSLSISRRNAVAPATPQWVTDRARQAVATVAMTRSVWQRHHVLAEAQRIVRSAGHAADDTLAQRITAAALAEPISLPLARIDDGAMGEPAALRRRDGSSAYTRHGTALFTSAEILSAERRILHAATLDGRRTVTDADVDIALEDSAARGKNLNPGQVALVTDMATNGRRVALALAPAGAGKTTAMAALSHAWRNSGGTVLGLAPTAAAAINLGADLSAPTDTLDKYIHLTNNASRSAIPQWFSTVNASTLLIVDEAGKAGTLQLDAVISHALAKGATVRLVGDDGQIASISAGGVLRDIAAETDALTLSQLVRFTAPEEGAASLALRAGDPSGIGFYIDHGRVHVGADETAADTAFPAWLTDQRAGRDTLLLAPTNAIVDELNVRARTARLAALAQADPQWRPGRETVLADQLAASSGDIIRTRDNARWLRMSATDYVRNGYTYEVLDVGADGSLRVRHIGTDREITLPADYVATEVTLGYATTIDGAQGLTAGHSCHVVAAEHITRQLLYVALTRGRVENHVYPSTAEDDPHRILSPKATHPDTAVDVLSKILARDGAQVSATTAEREAADPLLRIAAAADMYHDALGSAAENHLGATRLDKLATLADTLYPRLTHAEGWPVLRNHLALLACAGHNPAKALSEAAAKVGSTTPTRPLFSIGASTPPAATRPASAHCAGCPPYPTDSARTRNGVNTCIVAAISSPNSLIRFEPPHVHGQRPPHRHGPNPLSGRHRGWPPRSPCSVRRTEWRPRTAASSARNSTRHGRAPSAGSCKTPLWTRSVADTPRSHDSVNSSTPSTPASAPTASGHSWPSISPKPHPVAPTSRIWSSTRPPNARCPTNCPPPRCGGGSRARSATPPPWTPPTRRSAHPGSPICTPCSARLSPKPLPPIRPGPHWSPRSPPPTRSAGRRAICFTWPPSSSPTPTPTADPSPSTSTPDGSPTPSTWSPPPTRPHTPTSTCHPRPRTADARGRRTRRTRPRPPHPTTSSHHRILATSTTCRDGSTTHSSTTNHHHHTPVPSATKNTSAACSSRTSPPAASRHHRCPPRCWTSPRCAPPTSRPCTSTTPWPAGSPPSTAPP